MQLCAYRSLDFLASGVFHYKIYSFFVFNFYQITAMSKKIQREIDFQACNLHVREAEGEEKSRTVEGHAVIFGQRSVNLTPWSSYREVYEIIERGSITPEIRRFVFCR